MRWFKELNFDQLMIFWLSLIFLGAFVSISYQNFLDYQLNLHVLQCVEKTVSITGLNEYQREKNAEICKSVIQK